MGFYNDLVEGLKGMIGQGEKYANPTQMAKACDVAPNQIIRYIKQERGKHIQVLAKVLDNIGAKIIFPGQANGTEKNFITVPKALPRPNSDAGLKLEENSEDTLAFNSNWLAGKGCADSMKLLTVTGSSMAPRIEDGNSVLVDESQIELFEGRLYAIRIDDEIIVRRVAKEPGKILLIPDSPEGTTSPIILDINKKNQNWEPVGRVIFIAKDLL